MTSMGVTSTRWTINVQLNQFHWHNEAIPRSQAYTAQAIVVITVIMRHSREYHGPRWVVEYSRHNTLDGRRHTISAKYGLKKQKQTHLQVFHSVLETSLLLPSSPCQPLSSIAVRLPSQALRPPLWRVNGVFPQRDRLCFPTHHHHHQPSNPSKTQDIKTKY